MALVVLLKMKYSEKINLSLCPIELSVDKFNPKLKKTPIIYNISESFDCLPGRCIQKTTTVTNKTSKE